jgi:hypothetical protein
MSDLSNIKNEFLSFLTGVLAQVPAEAQPAVQAAASSVTTAISTTESALVSTAEAAAPTVLSSVISKDVPTEFQPLASLALQLGIAALTAKAGL